REDDFEPVSHQVDVIQTRNSVPQTYTLMIRLRDKIQSVSKPSVINAELAGTSKRSAVHYRNAIELSKAGKTSEAIERLNLAVLSDPGFASGYNELGVQYLNISELDKAMLAFQSALKISPDSFEPTVNLGIAQFRLKQFADAESALRKAITIKADAPIAHFYLGRTLMSLERYEDAEKELNLSLMIGKSEMKEAHRMLAMMYIAMDERQKAVTALETYLGLAPTAPDREHLRLVIEQLKGQTVRPPNIRLQI
ncbi:MAG: tetratricopeptide repeat protein, partial [Pyrinomonadaceae bacterium]